MENIDDPSVQRTYRRHLYAIARRRARLDQVRRVYNFPVMGGELSMTALMDMILKIYREQQHPFRINFAFGLILDNVRRRSDEANDDDADDVFQPRYFHAFRNTHVFTTSPTVRSFSDMKKLGKRMESMTFLQDLKLERPDTSWVLALLTNVRFVVTISAPYLPLACSDVEVHDFLKKKKKDSSTFQDETSYVSSNV
jgi:hypothetical protein